MKVVFMGTPDFAITSLEALLQNNFEVVAVVTQPDRPAGRGKKMRPSPVKTAALKAGLPVYQPQKIADPGFIQTLTRLNPEVIVVVAFGQILPREILKLPRYGCINVHASLLPGYRGAAPIHRVVMNGERETGVTIMQMDAGLDSGDMLTQEKITIGPDDTAGIIHDKLAALGGKLLIQALHLIKRGLITPVPQDDKKSSYARMLGRQDEVINWQQSAAAIKNQIRGLNPWPGARTTLGGKLLKIWRVDVAEGQGIGVQQGSRPGQIVGEPSDQGILVQTGDGVLVILELQLQGKKSMDVATFLRGTPVTPGTVLGSDQDAGGGST